MSKPIAIILGASQDRAKFGNKAVRAHLAAGFMVVPVNPRGGEIEGLKVYPSLEAVPDLDIDRISVYLPPDRLLPMLPAVAICGCRQLWLNPGAESDTLLSKCRELGIPAQCGCSIVDVGFSPADFS